MSINAQGFKTRHVVPASLNNNSKFIFETTVGNYISGGLVSDTVNGGIVSRLAIMGLDNNGQILWTKKYGDGTYQYLFNQFIRRSFYKQGNFIYHACCVKDTNNRQVGALIQFDLNGDTLWQKIYRDVDPLEDLIPQMVTGSVDGGFLITGFFQHWGDNPYSKCLLIKTDANGNELWRKKIAKLNPNVQDGKAIVQDSASKKIVIVGYQYIGGTNSYDNVLILDSLGIVQNHLNYNSFGGIFVDLIQTKDKKMVAVGQKLYSQTVGGDNLGKAFAVKFDIDSPNPLIWKIDGYGPLVLKNSFNCIYELENGDFLLGGDLDTVQILNLPHNTLNRLTIIDKDGHVKWSRMYDYRTDSNAFHIQNLTSLNAGSNGSILASFQLHNTPTPNPFFFVKYDSTGCDSTELYCATTYTLGLNSLSRNETFRIFPNPVKDVLSVETGIPQDIDIRIYDVSGREVKKVKLNTGEKTDVSDLSPGIYLLSLSRDKEVIYTTKLIKE